MQPDDLRINQFMVSQYLFFPPAHVAMHCFPVYLYTRHSNCCSISDNLQTGQSAEMFAQNVAKKMGLNVRSKCDF